MVTGITLKRGRQAERQPGIEERGRAGEVENPQEKKER
jgi:hypothetical protein